MEVCSPATSSADCALEPLPISQIHLVAQMIQIEANRPAKLRKGDVAPMKRTILMMAMVIGCGISSPTFGFDLLDRMLGIKCGSSCDTAACDAPADCEAEPACGCEEPACGCEEPAGEEGPACGCEEPVCGCEPAAEGCEDACDSPAAKSCGGLLSKLFPMMNGCDSGCDEADEDPACGCEPIAEGCEDACDSPAGAKCSGLLAKLFSTCSDKGCDSCDAGEEAGEPACGCEEPACGCEPACGVAAPVTSMKAAPIPAPVVDPSARVSTNRRVIQASAVYVR